MKNISNHSGAFFVKGLQPRLVYPEKNYRHKTPRESKVINSLEGFVWASLILASLINEATAQV